MGRLLHGRYRILDVIAKGGMGMVYDAIHVGLRRRVAIKTLRTQYAHSKTAIARFHKEAALAGRFGHGAPSGGRLAGLAVEVGPAGASITPARYTYFPIA